ncbi:MAG TPA: DUF3093 domain-containing protein [Propionibacteriaceae bacterium]|nr:DUF3093 domain-containing protein [Propionibacteriaceae bacterium]HQE31377.1 DUF3093 domain-containing protein [Propionibacteriaceae bacterium]
MTYSERLWPPLLWWVIAVIFGLTFVVAVAVRLPPVAGVLALVVALLLVGGVLLGSAAKVSIIGDDLQAGAAHLPLQYAGTVTQLNGPALRERMGVRADPRAYLLYRAFCDGAVEVEVTDPADPHPYWLVSSRRPDQLATAIQAAKGVDPVKGSER